MNIPFTVSTNALVYAKNIVSTQKIKIDLVDQPVLDIKLTYSLPECFKFQQTPNSIEVTYDGNYALGKEYLPEDMFIRVCPNPDRIGMDRFEDVIISIKFEEDSYEQKLESLECRICALPFSDEIEARIPRMLSNCGHTICEECVNNLKLNHWMRSVICPFDRKETKGTSEFLPKNYTVLEILEERKETERQKMLNESSCSNDPDVPCYENPKHESTLYCTTCKEDFCHKCFKSTHSSKIFSSHTGIPITDKPVTLPNCPVHPDLSAEFLCTEEGCLNESKLICANCLLAEHKKHNHQNLKEHVENNEKKLREMAKNLQRAQIIVNAKSATIEKCSETFEKTGMHYLGKVASITRYFDEKKEKALDKLNEFVELESEKLEFEKRQVEYDSGLVAKTEKEIEKELKIKTRLHDIDEIINRGTTICGLDTVTNKEDYKTFNSFPLTVDMEPKNEPSPNVRKRRCHCDNHMTGPSTSTPRKRPQLNTFAKDEVIHID